LRAAYLDLDGTLLGAGASLFHDGDGQFSMLGARALEACSRAEIEVVPYSGRRQASLLHDTRMLGLRASRSRPRNTSPVRLRPANCCRREIVIS